MSCDGCLLVAASAVSVACGLVSYPPVLSGPAERNAILFVLETGVNPLGQIKHPRQVLPSLPSLVGCRPDMPLWAVSPFFPYNNNNSNNKIVFL